MVPKRRTKPRPGAGRGIWPLHNLALCGFIVAQPLYDLLRRFGPFLVAHASQAADVVVLTLTLSLLVPLALSLPAALAAMASRRLGWWVHLATVGGLLLLLGLQLARRWNPAPDWDLQLAGLVALAALAVYTRFVRVQRGLTWLVLPAALFPLLFLFLSPVRSLVLPGSSVASLDLPRQPSTPVFLVVLDEFPLFSILDEEERIDDRRFPNLAALAADSAWFRNATTVAQSTAYGVPAILSGRYPFKDVLLPVAKDYRSNLFTLLGRNYNLNVMETGTRMCPLDLCTGAIVRPALAERMRRLLVDSSAVYLHLVAPRNLAERLPNISDGWQGFWREKRPRRRLRKADYVEAKEVRRFRWDHPRETVEEFLASIERFPRPTLHYLHVLLPHTPWRNLPDGHSFDSGAAPGAGERYWSGTEWQMAQGLQRHLLQVGFVDRVIGQFRDLLEEQGIYDESLIVVVSDHGAAFRLHQARRWLEPEPVSNLSDLANIPLLVKFPSGSPRGVDDRNAETIDVLPTILDILGVEIRDLALDGVSLARPDVGRERKTIYPTRGNKSARGIPIEFRTTRLAARREMIRFKGRYLGWGGWASVFALGPHGSLVGQPADAPALEPHSERLALDGVEDLARVDFGDELLPLWIAGSIGDWARERWVAVIINNKIAAVTQTYENGGAERFGALVAPGSLSARDNQVEVRALAAGATRGANQ